MGKEFIIRIIENSGKTKKQFANVIGVRSATVDKWLSGTYRPSIENQKSIREKFKKEISQLYKN
jgi:DNA-binding XRE family transcriptional regulator